MNAVFCLQGGWPYTKAIYDLSAYHAAADVLSWEKPRLVRFKSFLTPQEVGHLVAVAKERLERSEVLTTNQSEAVQDVRTSFGAWPPSDEVTDEIVDRIHRLVGIPTEFGEGIYVLNYQHGQNYAAHTDSVVDTYRKRDAPIDEASRGFLERAGGPHCGYGHGGSACGDRIATFILYLKSPEIGGKTVFPKAEATQRALESSGITFDEFLNPQGEIEDLWYCNRTEALGVAPDAGDGILFWSYVPWGGAGTGSWDNQTADPMATGVLESEHSGCPVWGGEKWIATRWIRSAQFI
jgi:prolyl 4-hydroxylase